MRGVGDGESLSNLHCESGVVGVAGRGENVVVDVFGLRGGVLARRRVNWFRLCRCSLRFSCAILFALRVGEEEVGDGVVVLPLLRGLKRGIRGGSGGGVGNGSGIGDGGGVGGCIGGSGEFPVVGDVTVVLKYVIVEMTLVVVLTVGVVGAVGYCACSWARRSGGSWPCGAFCSSRCVAGDSCECDIGGGTRRGETIVDVDGDGEYN